MAKSIVTTICRTIAIVAVWVSAPSFMSGGVQLIGMRMDREAGPVYLVAMFMVLSAAVIATAILWLGCRPKRRKLPSADRAFEVVASQQSA